MKYILFLTTISLIFLSCAHGILPSNEGYFPIDSIHHIKYKDSFNLNIRDDTKKLLAPISDTPTKFTIDTLKILIILVGYDNIKEKYSINQPYLMLKKAYVIREGRKLYWYYDHYEGGYSYTGFLQEDKKTTIRNLVWDYKLFNW